MKNEFKNIMFSEDDIKKKINELGSQITNDYAESENLVLIGVLKGSIVFFSDLMKHIDNKCVIDFYGAESYSDSTVSSGNIIITKEISADIEGKDVILIDDIIDTGLTLKILHSKLVSLKPKSVKICVLLDKPERRTSDIQADYTGFTIPDRFVVGYGMDYCQLYRNLPFIAILK